MAYSITHGKVWQVACCWNCVQNSGIKHQLTKMGENIVNMHMVHSLLLRIKNRMLHHNNITIALSNIEYIEITYDSSMIRNSWLSVFVLEYLCILNLRAVFFVLVWTEQMNKRTFSCSYSSKFNKTLNAGHILTSFSHSSLLKVRFSRKNNFISDVLFVFLHFFFFIQTNEWIYIEVLVYFLFSPQIIDFDHDIGSIFYMLRFGNDVYKL